jgi:hypothetical protein
MFFDEAKNEFMNDRREFLKGAGLLGVASWGRHLPAHSLAAGSQPIEIDSQAESNRAADPADAVMLENPEMRLVIDASGSALSLVHKATGQECLAVNAGLPMFSLTQYRPYDNELQVSLPAQVTGFAADRVRIENNRLIVNFELVGYEASIDVKITDAYIAFRLERLTYKGYTSLRPKKATPIDQTLFVQLPIRDRQNFGEWLNVMWDDKVAVNLLGTDPFVQIGAEPRQGFHLFQARTIADVQLEQVGAALIATSPDSLLDRIARVEEDFDLPRGVESRRRQEYRYSYYETSTIEPANADEHIRYAKMAGLRCMDVYYVAFAKTVGHFPWRPEYPGQMRDLKGVVGRIQSAGMIPGIHIHYNKAHREDEYVTPRPDQRLNVRETFTLAASIDAKATEITVESNPRLCTLDDERRILKIQNELITYKSFSTRSPYRFLGCERGALNTRSAAYEIGSSIGVLDVDTWPIFVRFTQDTSIQDEVAERLREIYQHAGFKFVYFDGAEDVPPPYWFNVSRAQWVVNEKLDPRPLFAEGACKSHFSWHILTRGNAFDVFRPEVMKAATRAYPVAEAQRVAKDFTSINFGWIGYWTPGADTIGTQPDMLEYVASRATAWDCPVSLIGDLAALKAHPRTPDNLEALRRWEEFRLGKGLTAEQRLSLRNHDQEHTLLLERGDLVLTPWSPIDNAAGKDRPCRAFVFERSGETWVSYWHTSGEASLRIELEPRRCALMREPGDSISIKSRGSQMILPLGERRYLRCSGQSRDAVVAAFRNATVLST